MLIISTLQPQRNREPLRRAMPPQVPVNANVTNIFLTAGGGLIFAFDQPVTVDLDHPPTTWYPGAATGFLVGGENYGTTVYLMPNDVVNVGEEVEIFPHDPAARTASGGYVNGGLPAVSSM